MTKQTKKRLQVIEDQGFIQGVAFSAAEMTRAFGQTSMAIHLLQVAGIDSKVLKTSKVDVYDAGPCRSLLKAEKQRKSHD